jgi:cell division protein FtsL
MMRLNFVLLLAVIASALYLVSVQYESRRLFADLDRATLESRRIETEHEQLELQRRQQGTVQRVQQLARDRLGMRVASPAITDYVNVAGMKAPADGRAGTQVPAPAAGASAPSASGRVSGGRLP